MKFSVIVPVYNVEKYIQKCINSILMQTFKDFELILVNDGSTDGSMDIIEKISEKSNVCIHVIEQENLGQGSARNRGIKSATGDYLVFIDSDDFIDRNLLEIINDEIITYKTELICFNAVMVDDKGRFIRHYNMCGQYEHIDSISKHSDILLLPPAIWNKVCKKELFLRTNCWFTEGHIYEDTAVSRALFTQANSISFLDKELYFYVQRANSTMSAKEKKLPDILFANKDLLDWFKSRQLFSQYHFELETIAVRTVLFYALDIENMTDKNIAVQTKMVDFIKNNYSDFEENKYLSEIEKEKIKILFNYDFINYYTKFNRKKKFKIKLKMLLSRLKRY